MARYTTALKTYITEMKFGPNRPCAEFAGELLYRHTIWPEANCVTCTPLSWFRQAERGFNQAELMAKEFARLSGIPFLPLLKKTKYTSAQAETKSREERLTRLQNTYGIVSAGELQRAANNKLSTREATVLANEILKTTVLPQRVILIDDVCTTGATLSECGAILKHHGVQEVHGLTLAREL